jgi:AcrR family transcriptional regulator
MPVSSPRHDQPRENAGARPRAVGRPRAFSDDELIHAALELGPDDLSVSEVARALGVPRSTVYNRVATPEALGALVLQAKIEEVLSSEWHLPGGAWPDALWALVERFHQAWIAGGGWIRYYDVAIQVDEQSLRLTEDVMRRMVDQGLSLEEAGRAVQLVMALVRDDAVLRASVVFHGSIIDNVRRVAEEAGLDLMLDSISRSEGRSDDTRFRDNIALVIDGIRLSHEARRTRRTGDG